MEPSLLGLLQLPEADPTDTDTGEIRSAICWYLPGSPQQVARNKRGGTGSSRPAQQLTPRPGAVVMPLS